MAESKNGRFKISGLRYLSKHLCIVALPLILISLCIPQAFGLALLVFASHVVIDSAKFSLYPFYHKQQLDKSIFLLDQTLHLLMITTLYLFSEQITVGWQRPAEPDQRPEEYTD